MLGQFKPVVLEPAGTRRARRGPPRWLLVLLTGIAVGAGGVLLVQSRYQAPRMSPEESTEMRAGFEQAERERKRLEAELGTATQRLQAALAEKKTLADEAAKSRLAADGLREDVAALLAALPPDTRGGPIEVRAGRFTVESGKLAYNIVLSRRKPEGAGFNGVVQLIVSGATGGTGNTTFISNPLPFSVDRHQTLRGTVPMPDGFKPKQATIKVLDRIDGKQQGTRVMFVE